MRPFLRCNGMGPILASIAVTVTSSERLAGTKCWDQLARCFVAVAIPGLRRAETRDSPDGLPLMDYFFFGRHMSASATCTRFEIERDTRVYQATNSGSIHCVRFPGRLDYKVKRDRVMSVQDRAIALIGAQTTVFRSHAFKKGMYSLSCFSARSGDKARARSDVDLAQPSYIRRLHS